MIASHDETQEQLKRLQELKPVPHTRTTVVKSQHPSLTAWIKYTTRFIGDGSLQCFIAFKALITKKQLNANRR